VIYFVGGPPRVGKSIIAKAITKQHAISAVSTDSLGEVLESVLDPEVEPGLFAVSRFNEMAEADRIELMARNPAKRIEYQIEENRAVWRAVVPFVLREQEEGRDLVIEGVAVLPELVAQLEGVNFRVVFVGNQGHGLKENIKRSATENAHDWMRHASDEYIDAFVTFVMEISRYVEKEAHKYVFVYCEMDGRPFNDAVDGIVASLMK